MRRGALNIGPGELRPTLDLGAFPAVDTEVFRTVYRPGASETWADLGSLAAAQNVVVLPSRSVATIVVTAAPP